MTSAKGTDALGVEVCVAAVCFHNGTQIAALQFPLFPDLMPGYRGGRGHGRASPATTTMARANNGNNTTNNTINHNNNNANQRGRGGYGGGRGGPRLTRKKLLTVLVSLLWFFFL
jgi:hypothetical protein